MTGYRGRLAVTEIVVASPELERAIAGKASIESLHSIVHRSGCRSLWESGVSQLAVGRTSG